jgi:hypothetical protein
VTWDPNDPRNDPSGWHAGDGGKDPPVPFWGLLALLCAFAAVALFVSTPVVDVDGSHIVSKGEGLLGSVGLLIVAAVLAGRR